jgi:NAD(P)H-hydrate repair Nnr-like enzyme with NAD(P)H-hydrate dehydratase domain
MATTPAFIRQEDTPLYPKILYNRPVTRTGAGRLLVVGGYPGEFSLPTTIHQLSMAAGIGECSVVLPETLAKLLGGAPGTFYAPANPSGSLSPEGLGRILELSEDADAVALGASLSNNSTTAILIEKLVAELERPYAIFEDGLRAMHHNLRAVTDNPDALVIVTMAEVFKLCGLLQIPIRIREGAGLINKLEIIADLAAASRCSYAVYGTEIIVAAGGPLVVTPINYRLSLVPAIFYAVLPTFWLQSPTNRAAGLATGAYIIRDASAHLGATDRPSVGDLAAALDQARRADMF